MRDVTFSRRQFIVGALAAAGALSGFTDVMTALARGQALPPLAPFGQLTPSMMDNLMLVVNTFVGEDHGPTDHYRAYFDWRARNLPGYRTTYELFSLGLDDAARQLSGQLFAEADREVRQTIVHNALELPTAQSALNAPVLSSERPQSPDLSVDDMLWLRFNQAVLGEMIYVFMQTNAWIMLGYEGWPGQARGLDAYPLPVESGENL